MVLSINKEQLAKKGMTLAMPFIGFKLLSWFYT